MYVDGLCVLHNLQTAIFCNQGEKRFTKHFDKNIIVVRMPVVRVLCCA